MLRILLLLMLVAATGGGARAQLLTDSLLVGGHYRVFHFVPPPHRRAEVVFVLHGSGGNGPTIRHKLPGLTTLAPTQNLALVYPDGYRTYWNECRKAATTPPNLENIDEQAFFEQMLAYLHRRYHTQPRRAFAIGFSGGGHMAYKLALTMPHRFRAVVAVVANLPEPTNMDCAEARRPVAVMIVNGTADPVNPYAGGEVQATGVVFGRVRSTAETLRYWTELAGYPNIPAPEQLPDPDPTDAIHLERTRCADRHRPEVVLITVVGGRHEFPKDLDMGAEAWAFFQRQLAK